MEDGIKNDAEQRGRLSGREEDEVQTAVRWVSEPVRGVGSAGQGTLGVQSGWHSTPGEVISLQ